MRDFAPIESLFDFYQRWSGLRPHVMTLIASERLDAREREILTSLVDLADRVGPDDLLPDGDVG
ncbi:MAG: hypothetical protein ACK5JR_21160 [Tropicimonas sp.]|uniref:hypothetical protein n=1 Tax=Tropicimonas sp. TaxID=2067044 RepID=UPI003A8589E7